MVELDGRDRPKAEKPVLKPPMSEHLRYKFSVTIHTDELAILGCLRALAPFSQKQGNKNITSVDANDENWTRDGHCVVFRFSATQYRDGFLAEARRLLPNALWHRIAISDDDPESPQR
jgi:hypothetical protein